MTEETRKQKDIAIVDGRLQFDGVADAMRIGRMLVVSGFAFGHNENTATQAIIAGAEMGLSPFESLRGIAMINNRPTVWGEILRRRAEQDPQCLLIDSGCWSADEVDAMTTDIDQVVADYGGEHGRAMRVVIRLLNARRKAAKPGALFGWAVTIRRRSPSSDATSIHVQIFDADDARRAGLADKKGPWSQYPRRMLTHRAATYLIRDQYPGACPMDTAEEATELGGGDVVVQTIERREQVGLAPEVREVIEAVEAEQAASPTTEPATYPSETVAEVREGPDDPSSPRGWVTFLVGKAIDRGADHGRLQDIFRDQAPGWHELEEHLQFAGIRRWAAAVPELAGVDLTDLVEAHRRSEG